MDKRRKIKRVIAWILVCVTFVSVTFGGMQDINALTENNSVVTGMDGMIIKGENSFGNLLVSELEAKLSEQEENNGCNIFSIEVSGKEASVSFETVEDCTLVVGIYDEAGEKMLASGSREVLSGQTDIVVFIETDSMPQYFYVKGFLVDTNSFRPLCIAYESPNYTKEMQDFFAKTTDDFDQDKVINFDDDKTSNFAVFSENTKVIQESAVSNQVVRADDEQNVYVIENADNNIMSLQAGEIFAQKYDNNNILIVKIASIQIDGTTVTITGEETSLEEVFDYVKIEGESRTEDAVVDASSCEEGVIYNGLVETQYESVLDNSEVLYSNELLERKEENIKTLSVEFEDKLIGSAKINGGLNLGIGCEIKAYVSFTYSYMELKIDYSAKVKISVSGKASREIPLVFMGFCPVPGVIVEFTPSFVVEVSAKIELTGELSGTVGFLTLTKEGIKNLTSKPRLNTSLKVEGKVFIGMSFETRVKVICDEFAKASMKVKIGAEVIASKKEWKKETTKWHECNNCIEGEIVGKRELYFEVKFLNLEKLKFKLRFFDSSSKIADFYYSWDFNEFAFTTCPHCQYKVSVLVKDSNGNPVNDAVINNQYHTDENGKTSFFLPNGVYGITVKKDKSVVVRQIKIRGEAQRIEIGLGSGDSSGEGGDVGVKSVSLGNNQSAAITKDGSLYTWGSNSCGQLGDGTTTDSSVPKKILENVETVSLGEHYSAVITKDGSLYMWGKNHYGQLGDGTTTNSSVPKKILENVETVSLEEYNSAAITKDGSLYTWGSNSCGQLGDGTTTDSSVPKKILENVETVSLGEYYSAAITEDGSLYMWGANGHGQLGDGTTTNSSVPKKILENVETVSLKGPNSAAITKDGSLYTWGWNGHGQLGDGTTNNSHVPKKILENVETVSLGEYYSAVITKDGSLYMWGWNNLGQLGNGTATDSLVPKKIFENVETVSLAENYNMSAAITKDGSLYTWGANGLGQLGDGTTNNSYVPKKILENVETVSLIGYCSAAITKDGSLYTWGVNSSVPKKILENVETVSLKGVNRAAITKDGSLYTWGWNNFGQLGDGTTTDSSIPKKIEFPPAGVFTTTVSRQSSLRQENYEMSYKDASSNVLLTQFVPSETYNFYVVKSNTGNNTLVADNLLYITQAVSDSKGKLNITYEPKENYENAKTFAVAMHQNNISLAQVELNSLTYNGTEQYVNPVVTYNGLILTEGKDYELHRDYSAVEAGEYTVVIHGIGSYFGTKEVNYSVVGNSQPSQPDPVRDFVNRLYTLVLEREADEGGLDSWTSVLLNHQSSGVDAGYGFVFSEECRERNLSNDDFVETLYNTFMNRPSDEGGKSAWVSQLDAGVEREKIFEGFVYSQEFAFICSEYGINMGDVQDVAPLWAVLQNYRNRNADITKFVARCYTEALERDYEIEGLESWCRVIHERSNTPKQVAQNFIFSDEFVGKNLNNEEYVKVLYRTFMGHEADEGGLAAWVNVLKSGREDRAKVLEGFSDSVEFAEILQQFGLR